MHACGVNQPPCEQVEGGPTRTRQHDQAKSIRASDLVCKKPNRGIATRQDESARRLDGSRLVIASVAKRAVVRNEPQGRKFDGIAPEPSADKRTPIAPILGARRPSPVRGVIGGLTARQSKERFHAASECRRQSQGRGGRWNQPAGLDGTDPRERARCAAPAHPATNRDDRGRPVSRFAASSSQRSRPGKRPARIRWSAYRPRAHRQSLCDDTKLYPMPSNDHLRASGHDPALVGTDPPTRSQERWGFCGFGGLVASRVAVVPIIRDI